MSARVFFVHETDLLDETGEGRVAVVLNSEFIKKREEYLAAAEDRRVRQLKRIEEVLNRSEYDDVDGRMYDMREARELVQALLNGEKS